MHVYSVIVLHAQYVGIHAHACTRACIHSTKYTARGYIQPSPYVYTPSVPGLGGLAALLERALFRELLRRACSQVYPAEWVETRVSLVLQGASLGLTKQGRPV